MDSIHSLARKIDWHHAALQGTFFAGYCALWSFVSLFLLERDFTNAQIGIITSLAMLLPLIFQPLMSGLLDRSRRLTSRFAAIMLTLLVMLLALLLLCTQNHMVIAVCYICIGIFLNSTAPLFNAMAMEYELHGVPVNYGFGRGMGSVLYGVMSLVLGLILEGRSSHIIVPVFEVMAILLLLSLLTFRYPLPAMQKTAESSEQAVLSNAEVLRRYPSFTLLLIGCALLMSCHITIATYFIHICHRVGEGEALMGSIAAISAFVELPAMMLFPRFRCHFSVRTLLRVCAVFFFIKAVLYTVAGSPALLYFTAFLQFIEFGILLPATVSHTAHLLGPANLVKGQGLYFTVSNCVGPALSSLVSGTLLDRFGLTAMMLFLTFCALAGAVLLWFVTKSPSISAAKEKELL